MRKCVFVIGFPILAAFLAGCARQQAATPGRAAEPAPVPAKVITVAAEAFHAVVPVTGTLISPARVDVKAEVVGRITRFDKEEAAHVEAGEPVAWVNDENYQLSLRQAETGVKLAQATLERALLVESHSRSELDRAQNLLKSGGITDKDLKTAELADRDAAAQVLVAKAQVEQAQASLDLSRKHIRDTIIRAPIAGEIQRKDVNTGAYVEAATVVMTIVDNSRLELQSSVATADLGTIRAGQRATFQVNSYPEVTFAGRVVEINPAVDEQTRSARVRIAVDNPARKLKAGMFGQGEILTAVDAAAVIVPGGAVYRDDRSAKSAYVFVVQDGKAARREVRIGRERDSRLEILDGLRPGDRLIAEQSIEIAEGVRVEPRS